MATFPFNDPNSFLDMMRKFGTDLKVPKFDLDQMVEAHRKNIEALTASMAAMTEGAQDTAQLTRVSAGEAVKILQERMRQGLEEVRKGEKD